MDILSAANPYHTILGINRTEVSARIILPGHASLVRDLLSITLEGAMAVVQKQFLPTFEDIDVV